jgi:hypothetical protein
MGEIVLAAYAFGKKQSLDPGSVMTSLSHILQPLLTMMFRAGTADPERSGGGDDKALVGKALLEALLEAGHKAAREALASVSEQAASR